MHIAAHTAARVAILAYAARDEAGVEGLGRRAKKFRLAFSWYKLWLRVGPLG